MRLSVTRTDVPQWVLDNWMNYCPHCGAYIVDNSDTGVTTARWCVNPSCPGHMAHKAKFLADFFNIVGFGPQTALNTIKPNNYKSHFDFMKKWFGDTKPLVTLADVATLACIEGYGATQAKKDLLAYRNFEHYFSTCYMPNATLLAHREELLYAETFFTLKPPLSANKMLVMATGSFHGYDNRDEFFRLLNDAYGSVINVIQTGKRKTGVSYLIKEVDAVDHSKSRIAKECGIPIVTPAQFLDIISSMCPYINNEE